MIPTLDHFSQSLFILLILLRHAVNFQYVSVPLCLNPALHFYNNIKRSATCVMMLSVFSLLQRSLVLVCLFQVAVSAASIRHGPIRFRQASTQTTPSVTCLDYGNIANLSTIGLNSTYRAAYLKAAPDGTAHSASLLNNAQKALPPLTANEPLNQECGNLTTIALAEAANNFTQGVVGQYRISAATVNHGELGMMVALVVMLGMLTVI